MKNVKSIVHVALDVSNIEASLEFYVGKLGFEEMYRVEFAKRLGIVNLRITDTQYLELFPVAADAPAPAHNVGGLHHLCLAVEDIDAVIAEITARGVVLTRPRKLGMDGNVQAWIADPDGNRIELMQVSPGSLTEQAIERLTRERNAKEQGVSSAVA
jgi:lactoylglutathione lyase